MHLMNNHLFFSVFRDTNTPNPFIDPDVPKDSPEDIEVMKPNHVHLDCVTTGLGCGCLQVPLSLNRK